MARNHERRPRANTGDRFDANAPPRRAGNGLVEPRDEYASHDATPNAHRERPRTNPVAQASNPENSLMRESGPSRPRTDGYRNGHSYGLRADDNTPTLRRARGRVGHNWTLFPPVGETIASAANNSLHRIDLEDHNSRSQNGNLPFDQSHLPPRDIYAVEPDDDEEDDHCLSSSSGSFDNGFPDEEVDEYTSGSGGSYEFGPPDRRFDEGYDSDSFDALHSTERGSIPLSSRLTSNPSERPRLQRARPLRDYGIENGSVSPTTQHSRRDIEASRQAYFEEYRARRR